MDYKCSRVKTLYKKWIKSPNAKTESEYKNYRKLKSAQRDTNLRAGTLQPDRTF